MRWILGIICLLSTLTAYSEQLPPLPSEIKATPYKFFLTSEQNTQSGDNWNINIDGGYIYGLFNNIDLYVGARINQSGNSETNFGGENGFLSGISYQITDRISVRSMLHSYFSYENDQKISNVAAELSSRLQLSDDLDLHATLDYKEWQQGIEVGLGFRF